MLLTQSTVQDVLMKIHIWPSVDTTLAFGLAARRLLPVSTWLGLTRIEELRVNRKALREEFDGHC